MAKHMTAEGLVNLSWVAFVKKVPAAPEQVLWDALKYERRHRDRREYKFRLHRKANRLRYEREKKEHGI